MKSLICHNRKSIDCGAYDLDWFIQQYVVKDRKLGISGAMVLPSLDDESMVYSLLPSRFPWGGLIKI